MDRIVKIGLGVGCLWLAAKIALRNLVVGVSKATFRSIDVAKGMASINLFLSVQNPLPFGVTLKKISGNLYAQGHQVGYVNTELNYLCGGERIHTIPIVVNLSFDGVMRAVWDNIQSGNVQSLIIDFDGSVRLTKANIAIPLDLSFNYKDIVG